MVSRAVGKQVSAVRKAARRYSLRRSCGDVFSVAVEITNICNLKCGFCPNPTIPASDRYTISVGEFERILERLSGFFNASGKHETAFSPSGLGEVFLVPEIAEYLRAARRILPGARIDVASNFTSIDGAAAKAIIEEGLIDNLSCSMNYFDRGKYREICGRDALPEVFGALDLVTGLMKENGSRMKLFIAMKNDPGAGAKDKREFEEMAAERWGGGALVCWGDVGNWGAHLDLSAFSVDPDSRLAFPCHNLFLMKLFVNGAGDVYPCCCCAGAPGAAAAAPLRLGNVFTSGWRSIRRRFRRIRNMHLRGEWENLPLCAECNVYTGPDFDIFFKAGPWYF